VSWKFEVGSLKLEVGSFEVGSFEVLKFRVGSFKFSHKHSPLPSLLLISDFPVSYF
jgi:hypothetical protein